MVAAFTLLALEAPPHPSTPPLRTSIDRRRSITSCWIWLLRGVSTGSTEIEGSAPTSPATGALTFPVKAASSYLGSLG
jgi:hypothetical protein